MTRRSNLASDDVVRLAAVAVAAAAARAGCGAAVAVGDVFADDLLARLARPAVVGVGAKQRTAGEKDCGNNNVSTLGDLHASGLIVGLNCRSPDQKHPVKINILLLLLLPYAVKF